MDSGINFSLGEIALGAVAVGWFLFKGSVGRNVEAEDAFKKETKEKLVQFDKALQEVRESHMKDNSEMVRAVERLTSDMEHVSQRVDALPEMVKEEIRNLQTAVRADMTRLVTPASKRKR